MGMLFSRERIFGIALLVLPISFGIASPRLALSGEGLGAFKFGMSLAEVNAGLRETIVPPALDRRATANCYYSPVKGLPGVAFVFVDDTLKRIDVETASVHTAAQVSVGDRQQEAVGKIRHAKTEPLDYVPEGFTLVQETKDSPNGISYQFKDGKLVRIIAGDRRVIRFAEGCD